MNFDVIDLKFERMEFVTNKAKCNILIVGHGQRGQQAIL